MGPSFKPFTALSDVVDHATATFITGYAGSMIGTIAPFATLAVTLYFTLYGLAIVQGKVQAPVQEFINKLVVTGILLDIALNAGNYSFYVSGPLSSLGNDMAQALTGVNSATFNGTIDAAAYGGLQMALQAFGDANLFDGIGGAVACVFQGIIIILATAVVVAIGGAWVLLAKVALSLLLGIGPLFVFSLGFKPTARFFDAWLGQCLNYVLLTVMVAAVFGFLMTLFANFTADMQPNASAGQLWQNVLMLLILAIAAIIIMLQLPAIASALGGGSGISSVIGGMVAGMVAGAIARGGKKGGDGGDDDKKSGGEISQGGGGGGGAYSAGKFAGSTVRAARSLFRRT